MAHFKNLRQTSKDNDMFNQLTLGEVIDTNDPQQMGRIRIACPYFGDNEDTIVEDIPWATPISPMAGVAETMSRGRDNSRTSGPIAYGMFNVPKIGSYALVACIEGDPKFRIYLGGMYDQFLLHTLPHGRYTYKKTTASEEEASGNEPSGPLSSTEDPIQPLYDSQTETFSKSASPTEQTPPVARKSFEYRTRGADQGVAGNIGEFINSEDIIYSSKPDDVSETFTENDGNEIKNTHGYNKSRIEEGLRSKVTDYVYDPQIYSWTTPGFHSISMSDNADNCRIRVRTTHGHQIIMDDTNERVYIGTAAGKTWIELDEKGNIDIYGERNISVHAEKDINFTAGDTFRVKAKNGIHLASEGEVRVHAKSGDLHLKSGGSMEINATGTMDISVSNLFLTANTDIHIKASSGVLNLESGGDTNVLAGGQIIHTGSQIHFNGPAADAAFSSTPSNTFESWWTSRVPEHEPWARTMTTATKTDQDSNNTHDNSSEFTYNSPDVGRKERGFDLGRNLKWHR